MLWTEHAKERWAERLAEFDPAHEYYLARIVSRALKRRIRELCPAHARYMLGFNGFYYLRSPNVIWVMAAPETVVTVWPVVDTLERTPSRRGRKQPPQNHSV